MEKTESKSKPTSKPIWLLRPFLTAQAKRAWLNQDSQELSIAHKASHMGNPLLNSWFNSVYETHRGSFATGSGVSLELGSGGSQFKSFLPELTTSDVLKLEGVDLVVDAQKMSFAAGEISNITMINVLHHIPKPLEFFKEADRCLKNGGRLVFTEPYVSFLSFFVYRFVHHEPCILNPDGPELAMAGDALLDSNQALPTLLMRKYFNDVLKAAPHLQLVKLQYHSALSYFLTGGVNFRMPIPLWLWRFVDLCDRAVCRVFGRFVASFMTVVFEKTDSKAP